MPWDSNGRVGGTTVQPRPSTSSKTLEGPGRGPRRPSERHMFPRLEGRMSRLRPVPCLWLGFSRGVLDVVRQPPLRRLGCCSPFVSSPSTRPPRLSESAARSCIAAPSGKLPKVVTAERTASSALSYHLGPAPHSLTRPLPMRPEALLLARCCASKPLPFLRRHGLDFHLFHADSTRRQNV